MDLGEIWKTALGELQLQMTRSTFSAWLQPTQALGFSQGVLVVGVENQYAQEWLSTRLRQTIERVVAGIVEGETQVVFVVSPEASTSPSSNGKTPPEPKAPEFVVPDYDPLEAGWFKVSEYGCRFWAPLLGRIAWRVWEIVWRTDVRKHKTEWTGQKRFTAPELALLVPCGVQAITGVWRKVEDPAHPDAVLRDDGVHRRWQRGAFDRLKDDDLARIKKRGQWRHRSYLISVRTSLPILRPDQVVRLSGNLQTQHDDWLRVRGFDPRDWDMNYA